MPSRRKQGGTSSSFSAIPTPVIEYVRGVFADANNKVTRTMSVHPSMHEESLDHSLITELSTTPAVFFSKEQVGVALESHWLGGRHMFGRWEIADIAFFVILRQAGRLVARKVALLQTKRLYSKEIPVAPSDPADFMIGIGRIVDRTDPQIPLSRQRCFRFDSTCSYSAVSAGHEQVKRIDEYAKARQIPVYYGLYNPVTLPHDGAYPATLGSPVIATNAMGIRVLTATIVHKVLALLDKGTPPTVDDLTTSQLDPKDANSVHGWRIENFIADEVLRCREGRLFDSADDPTLESLLYRRSAPIQAAISITIDVGGS
jgi:hypothetical protein